MMLERWPFYVLWGYLSEFIDWIHSIHWKTNTCDSYSKSEYVFLHWFWLFGPKTVFKHRSRSPNSQAARGEGSICRLCSSFHHYQHSVTCVRRLLKWPRLVEAKVVRRSRLQYLTSSLYHRSKFHVRSMMMASCVRDNLPWGITNTMPKDVHFSHILLSDSER